MEGNDSAWRSAVVEDTQLIQFQVIDGKPVRIDGMEGKADLIHRDGEAVRRQGLSLGLRLRVIRMGTDAKEQGAEYPRVTQTGSDADWRIAPTFRSV